MSDPVAHSWDKVKVDAVLREAINAKGWKKPTTVQGAAVPLILAGRDVAIHSRTGTGKTGAFAIPVGQRILTQRNMNKLAKKEGKSVPSNGILAVVLVPTAELCLQTVDVMNALYRFTTPRIQVYNLAGGSGLPVNAEVLVSTPAVLARALKGGSIPKDALQSVVVLIVDEADILVSHVSMTVVKNALPQTVQSVVMSATLTEEVSQMKGLLLHNATHVKLDESDEPASKSTAANGTIAADADDVEVSVRNVKQEEASQLKQYYVVATDECNRHTILYAMFRLGHITGKTLIYVDDEEDTYRLQFFLEQMSITSIVYDSSLPQNVRIDMLQRFQSGQVATLICTDKTVEHISNIKLPSATPVDDVEEEGTSKKSKKKSASKKDKHAAQNDGTVASAGLHRGIDFQQVQNVILFDGVDAPTMTNFSSYTHRIGRAGRANTKGTAITLLSLTQAQRVCQPLREYGRARGENIRAFKKLQRSSAASLQYRVDSVLLAMTRTTSRRRRVATVASELTRSEELQQRFSDRDTTALSKIVNAAAKHTRVDKAMAEVPAYMGLSTDGAKQFQRRVNADNGKKKTRSSIAAAAEKMKRQREDPLMAVVRKCRRKKQ